MQTLQERISFITCLCGLHASRCSVPPFAYKKFRGGLTSAFVGYELSYPDQRVGISESRGQWLLKCIDEAKAAKFVVSVRRFAVLGQTRVCFQAVGLAKGPLGPSRAAVSDNAVALAGHCDPHSRTLVFDLQGHGLQGGCCQNW